MSAVHGTYSVVRCDGACRAAEIGPEAEGVRARLALTGWHHVSATVADYCGECWERLTAVERNPPLPGQVDIFGGVS